MVGSVSGGCVEGAVVAEALDALETGRPRLLDYGVSDDEAFAVGLACGGRIRVLVEPVGVGQGPSRALVEELVAARAARSPVVYAVRPQDWQRRLVTGPGDALWPAAEAALVADQVGLRRRLVPRRPQPAAADGGGGRGAHRAGAGADGAAGRLRRGGGRPARGLRQRGAVSRHRGCRTTGRTRRWPSSGSDRRTAVVTLTHDPKLDDPAIMAALRAPVFYLGCLGSTRTHAKRVERLRAAGFGEAEIARIHAPVGADIGAKSPAEIAIAILAQITERLRRPETRP